ncbi:hypothetical protein [Nocardia rhizosphaerae]|uniref:DUF3558 domain-containing protein n=1 Tax=Nocardia rhizosphaerae TaxID=1691571 RepID=A0ABV8L2H8_9NOCA
MLRIALPFTALVLTGFLTACSSEEAAVPATATDASSAAAAPALGTDDDPILAETIGCDTVAAAVAPYIEGLVPLDTNEADQYGSYCNWETDTDSGTIAEIRSVEVIIEPGNGEVPTAQTLSAGGLTVIPDQELDSAGGIAYTLGATTAVAAVAATTVELPTAKVSITGGQWADAPDLDGPAAVGVAKQLLNIPG